MQKSRFINFMLVGLINTLFGYGMFALLLHLGLYYRYSLLIATICGILFNFKTIGILVFKSRNNRLIVRFVAVYLVIYLLNVESLRIIYMMGISILLGQAILVIPLAIVSYFLNKIIVFRDT
ncbi:GtrA family protein [Pseudanabaena sp. FACHB-1998]|uniref:GtrA family protein n=1 Tax=Pseudanabaena sp. FACHB-1998 TaxID=2692858 RepID=UPI0018EFDDAD|nr:GtrA family protein [Pseudanabaena sp. FACHB-1998]